MLKIKLINVSRRGPKWTWSISYVLMRWLIVAVYSRDIDFVDKTCSPFQKPAAVLFFVFRMNYKWISNIQKDQTTPVTVVLSSNQIGLLFEYYTIIVNRIKRHAKHQWSIMLFLVAWQDEILLIPGNWGFWCLMYWDLLHHELPFTNLDQL